jgi:hypothetical protein
MDDQDWKAAMSSEIFREFVAAEIKKEAQAETRQKEDDMTVIRQYIAGQIRNEAAQVKSAEIEVDARADAFSEFDEFEAKVKSSPEMLLKFKQAKRALIENPELLDKVDPKFVKGIMMMEIE